VADGIRIHDAQIEVSTGALESLLNRGGAEITVRKIDLSVTTDAVNALLAKAAPAGTVPPSVTSEAGRLQLQAERDGQQHRLDLQLGSLRLEISADGVRLTSVPAGEGE
jgi:hypothetical protein